MRYASRVPETRSQAVSQRSARVFARLAQAIGHHPSAVLVLPSTYFLMRYPPFWDGIDVVCQLTLPACSVNILHYPPDYCFLARIPFFIADLVGRGSGVSPFSVQQPSLPAVYLLVCCQHAALCLALRYFVFSIPATAFCRGLLTLLLASMSSFYAFAHTCGSDALVPVCWFAAFGAGIRLLQPGAARVTWIIYSAALLLGIGSRHASGALLVWLPALCAVLVGWRRFFPKSEPEGLTVSSLGRLGTIALTSGVFVFCGEMLIVGALCKRFQVIPRSSLGATLSDRISSVVAGLSEESKAKLCARVQSLSPDPVVKLTIASQIYRGPYYRGTNDVITAALVTHALRGEELDAERDRVILRATGCFYRAVPFRLLRASWRDFAKAVFHTSDTTLALVGPHGTVSAARGALKEPARWGALRAMPVLEPSTASAVLQAAKRDLFIRKWHRLPISRWCLLFMVTGIVQVRRKAVSPPFCLAGICILTIGALSCVAFFACVFYSPRYVLPLLVSVMACGSVLNATSSGASRAARVTGL